MPTKQSRSQQHSHNFCWQRKERCRSGPAWKSAVWNQTFSSAEAGVNSTMCANICAHHFGNTSCAKSGVLWVSALQGSAPHHCTISMDPWNSRRVVPAQLYLDWLWVCEEDECLNKFCTEQSHHPPAAGVKHGRRLEQWGVKSVHQVGYLWSCWKVLDVPLEWWLRLTETEIKK